MKQIQETEDPRLREDLERELDRLVARMETKGEQISALKGHQRKHIEQKRERKESRNHKHQRSLSLKGTDVEVITTIKTKSKTPTTELRTSKSQQNLEVLKKVKKLSSTLRKDDLSWD